jgi:hypothetical protein
VGMVVLLLPADGADVSLEARAAGRLAGLGVSHVSFLGDEETIAVVLEGWAFDSSGSSAEAATLVGGERCSGRALHPLAHVSVTADPAPDPRPEGGGDQGEQIWSARPERHPSAGADRWARSRPAGPGDPRRK